MLLSRIAPAGGLLALALVFGHRGSCRGSENEGGKPAATAEQAAPPSGFDTSALTPRERREWAAQLGDLLAPCPEVPVSLTQCLNESRPCKACRPAAEHLLKLVQRGVPKKDREEAYKNRFSSGKVKSIAVDGSPELGPPDAPVTIVEWADFQCPTCALFSPLLDALVHRFEGQVRLVYKFYPLESHPHGEPAARAAFAAGKQGKFWEMHKLLFENPMALESRDLERYAKQIGLDVAQFKADMASEEAKERIQKDKKQGDEIGLDGTPLIFINGRQVDLRHLGNPQDDLEAWVKLELEMAGKTPVPEKPKAPAAGSAAPAASAAPKKPEGNPK